MRRARQRGDNFHYVARGKYEVTLISARIIATHTHARLMYSRAGFLFPRRFFKRTSNLHCGRVMKNLIRRIKKHEKFTTKGRRGFKEMEREIRIACHGEITSFVGDIN